MSRGARRRDARERPAGGAGFLLEELSCQYFIHIIILARLETCLELFWFRRRVESVLKKMHVVDERASSRVGASIQFAVCEIHGEYNWPVRPLLFVHFGNLQGGMTNTRYK